MRLLKYFFYLFLYFSVVTAVFAEGDERPIIAPENPNKQQNNSDSERGTETPTAGIYQTKGGNFILYAGGYFQADLLDLYNAYPLKGDADVRAARLSVGFAAYQYYQFFVSYDFSTSNFYTLLFTYDNLRNFLLSIGQFSPIFGLENSSNTPFITFMELALPIQAFSPPYVPGVEIGFYSGDFVFYASAFGSTLGSTVIGPMPYGGTFSLAFSPIHTERRVVHLGISGWHQGMDSRHTIGFSTPPEIFAPNNGTLISVGNINKVSNYDVVDGSAAFVYGSFDMQSEYSYAWINRSLNFSSPQFSGYYVTASYFLTGESRLYSFKYASFVDITPIKGRHGAWQLALQYSALNLTDRGISGGREHNIAAGLNWYPVDHVEFLLDYVHAMAMPNSNGINQTANMYALRLQFEY